MKQMISRVAVLGLAMAALAACGDSGTDEAADTAAPAMEQAASSGPADYITAAVNSADRSEEQKARDENRKPAEVLALSGVKPGDTVVEFAGFGQYYTTMLSDIVGEEGEVHMIDLPYTEERAGEGSRAFIAAHPNTTYTLVNYNDVELPQDVDVVFNVLYYHDLPLNDIDVAALNRKIYDALKPGGTFLVVDHNAPAGSGTSTTQETHRIDPAVIREEVTAAGFELAVESDILAHPEDDMSKMVFTPGTRGLTDRTVFVFKKPE